MDSNPCRRGWGRWIRRYREGVGGRDQRRHVKRCGKSSPFFRPGPSSLDASRRTARPRFIYHTRVCVRLCKIACQRTDCLLQELKHGALTAQLSEVQYGMGRRMSTQVHVRDMYNGRRMLCRRYLSTLHRIAAKQIGGASLPTGKSANPYSAVLRYCCAHKGSI